MIAVRRRQAAVRARTQFPSWVHDDVIRYAERWKRIRDCIEGEEAVKEEAVIYLPRRAKMTDEGYASYVERAPYFNMSSRTVRSMVGLASRRRPRIAGIPDRLKTGLDRITFDNQSVYLLIKHALEECVSLGRYGLLVDMDREGKKPAYIEGFIAEHILDWTEEEIDGRLELTGVVLRTVSEKPRSVGGARETVYRYLILELVDIDGKLTYQQRIYESATVDIDFSRSTGTVVVPVHRGKPFDFIPFFFSGSMSNRPAVDRPPLGDISGLQVSHFQSSADLEYARFYTANPVYWAQIGNGDRQTEYELGPDRIWEVDLNANVGILEFNGSGLRYLESGCAQKEDMIAKLGGRLMGGSSRAVSESDNQLKMQEANEHSTLHNVVSALNEAMTRALKVWATWQDVTDVSGVVCEIPADFISDMFGAREIRVLLELYKAGTIPIGILHSTLQKAGIIPDWYDEATFRAALDDEDNFPNMPDVLARMRGFPDKKTWLDYKRGLREMRLDERTQSEDLDLQLRKLKIERDKLNKPPAPRPSLPPPEPAPGGGVA